MKDLKKDSREAEALLVTDRDVKVGGKICKARPLVLDDYVMLFADLGDVMKEIITKNPDYDVNKFSAKDFRIFLPVYAQLKNILARFLQVEAGWLGKNMTLAELSALLVAFLEVNDMRSIVENFKTAKDLIRQQQV